VVSQRGRRFLRAAAGRRGGCGHWTAAVGETAPESARHLWLKSRLLAICRQLGWAGVVEDPVTRADVWLPDARTALEVQLRPTDLRTRTRARYAAGAERVVWFVAPDVPARGALTAVPAVRFQVVDRDRTEVQPWSPEPFAGEARLVVYGPLWRWDGWRLAGSAMSGYRFLAAVLADELGWLPPGTPGLPAGCGGWIAQPDLAAAATGAVPAALSQQGPESVRLSDVLGRLTSAETGYRTDSGAR
jgi:hypothetical protein